MRIGFGICMPAASREQHLSRAAAFLYDPSAMPESPLPNLPEFSVSEIAAALKRTVEDSFPFVRVRGEISGLKFHSSGHVYFDLKDDRAVLNAVIWRGTASKLKTKPQAGLEVVCTGRVSTYAGSSRYQLIVEQVELAGAGALMAMLEERRKRLAAEGLFAAERKRPLPWLPGVIGVVTSPTGAVIRDIMHRLEARFPRRVLLWPVAVQGERAAGEVEAAIRGFNRLAPGGAVPRPDLLIVARGGGSLEDLMAFNEEIVVRAAAESTIPLISAIGHETDTTLLDFAADARAPTPTAAAEMAVPVRTELIAQTLDLERRNLRGFTRALTEKRRTLAMHARGLPRSDQLFAAPRQRFDLATERLRHALGRNLEAHRRAFIETATLLRPQALSARMIRDRQKTDIAVQRLGQAAGARIARARQRFDAIARLLEGVSYRAALARGFAVVRGADGTLKRRAAAIAPGEALALVFVDGEVQATAAGDSETSPRKAKPRRTPGDQGSLL
jgi:exodeoxyribonuclease VII large subunit